MPIGGHCEQFPERFHVAECGGGKFCNSIVRVIVKFNFNNNSTNPFAAVNGLFWVSTGGTPVLINQEFNAAFYGGTSSNGLALLGRFLLSNGTPHMTIRFQAFFSIQVERRNQFKAPILC